ncbi:MAG: hypothetical protein ACKV19_14095 [Verrucomicrobiales bacterium]
MVQESQWTTKVTHGLLWVFALAWAFDFKADVGEGAQGGSLAQALFLLVACLSGGAAMVLSGRQLLLRPGVWLLLLWWGFLGYIALTSLGQGVEPGRFARIVLPYLMIGLGLGVAQAAAGRGLTPMQIVTPMVAAGVINVVWRVVYGFMFKGATLETARMEVFSPAMNPLFAYLGAAMLLRPRFHWTNLAVAAVALGGVLISVTRGLLFPIVTAGVVGTGCFVLGAAWGVFSLRQIPRKVVALVGGGAFGLMVLGGAQVAAPTLIERWSQRLFHHAGNNTSADLSWLTREAEAQGMLTILEKDPVHFVIGKGMGGSYYWDPSYWPELWTVYPSNYDFSGDIWFNGHSVWTYTLFSGGGIGLVLHLAFFGAAVLHGLAAVRASARSGRVDGQTWLGFLPVFTVCCLLSESFTSNQLAERLAGVMLGLSAGLPQALYRSTRRRTAGVPVAGVACQPPSLRLAPSPPVPTHVR